MKETTLTSGFNTQEELIGYCEIHSDSELAKFSGVQINDMIMLAGYPYNFVDSVPDNVWLSLHSDMKELCILARNRIT